MTVRSGSIPTLPHEPHAEGIVFKATDSPGPPTWALIAQPCTTGPKQDTDAASGPILTGTGSTQEVATAPRPYLEPSAHVGSMHAPTAIST
ncbi:hypothetical protein GCM10022402_12400 [Salinactinospora qingdaonensis]|uniref:Uncharacterized protein n=1 Tax=Salinactinospora qingdaonensis TaxID=702744 RepID=A0ABP7F8E9_9ACTN